VEHVVEGPGEQAAVGGGEAADERGRLARGAHRVAVRQPGGERPPHRRRGRSERGDGDRQRDVRVQVERGERPAAGAVGHAEDGAAEARRRRVVGVPLEVGAHAGRPRRAEPEVEERVGEQGAGGERRGRRAEPAADRDVGVGLDEEAGGEGPAGGGAGGGEAADEQVVVGGDGAQGRERAGAGDPRRRAGVGA
jgi:hypothetical protein